MSILEMDFLIGDMQVNIKNKIKGLVINDRITWPGCKFGQMTPTECEWDFTDMTLERLINLAWNQFKVEVRSQYFKKLGSLDLIHNATCKDKTLKLVEVLHKDNKRNAKITKTLITSVNLMIEMGLEKKVIISGLMSKFGCEISEAHFIYESAMRN